MYWGALICWGVLTALLLSSCNFLVVVVLCTGANSVRELLNTRLNSLSAMSGARAIEKALRLDPPTKKQERPSMKSGVYPADKIARFIHSYHSESRWRLHDLRLTTNCPVART